jgi:predicted DNA-binding transcriptional regulator AlpA
MELSELPEIATRSQVADALGLTDPALTMMAKRGQGPPFIRLGRGVRYRRQDVIDWLNTRTIIPGAVRS